VSIPGLEKVRKRAYTLIETTVAVVVVGLLAGIAFFGFSAITSKTEATAGEAELQQIANSASVSYVQDRVWQDAIVTAVAEATETGKTFTTRADAPGLVGVRYSDAYGVVSWRAGDGDTMGLAMLSESGECVYAKIQGRTVDTWRDNTVSQEQCAGRYALGETAQDPDVTLPNGSGLVVTGGWVQAVLSWSGSVPKTQLSQILD
jgi:prepilin-type N-terminal cleavage/methylation domain-containing protein